jgi:hypothetical protein
MMMDLRVPNRDFLGQLNNFQLLKEHCIHGISLLTQKVDVSSYKASFSFLRTAKGVFLGLFNKAL